MFAAEISETEQSSSPFGYYGAPNEQRMYTGFCSNFPFLPFHVCGSNCMGHPQVSILLRGKQILLSDKSAFYKQNLIWSRTEVILNIKVSFV